MGAFPLEKTTPARPNTVKNHTMALVFAMTLVTLWASLAPAAIDDARTADAGIRKLTGRHLTLYTDLAGKEIDSLPGIFDQAFPQWCRYFGINQETHADWRVTAFLMKDKSRFAKAGLLPDDLPPFKHGFTQDHRFWLNEQPSDYYRRELFLHEGTHAFMFTLLGDGGPSWYSEGMAEYLGTHRWRDGRLTLGYTPRSRDESPEWGRVRVIQDAVGNHKALRLKDIVELPPTAHLDNEPYAWCWAAATLLDRHPRYQERFRKMIEYVRKPDFNERFYRLFRRDWLELSEEWQLMTADMEYGYDVARSAVDFTPGKIAPPKYTTSRADAEGVRVAADRGWQNTGLRLEAGETYRLTATGRYQVATEPKIWWCEPGGVSIRYYRGRPLGILLAAVRPDNPSQNKTSALLRPVVVGLGTTLSPVESGTLFLKINDSSGELGDNAGQLHVDVRRE